MYDSANGRRQPSRPQLRIEPAATVYEHQRPDLFMRQVDDVAVSGRVASVALDNARRHQVVDDGAELVRDVLEILVGYAFYQGLYELSLFRDSQKSCCFCKFQVIKSTCTEFPVHLHG